MALGGRLDAPPPPVDRDGSSGALGRRQESPAPCSSPSLADDSRLRPTASGGDSSSPSRKGRPSIPMRSAASSGVPPATHPSAPPRASMAAPPPLPAPPLLRRTAAGSGPRRRLAHHARWHRGFPTVVLLTTVWPFGHTVKQYSPDGKLLPVLGSPGKAGSSLSPLQFDQPAEIFIHSSGEIYIVDGDGGLNNRLIKLSPDLQVLWMHGERGPGLAQLYIPHSVAVDGYQRVWVADRGNKRIQVFNSVTGDWLGSWGSCFKDDAPYSVRFTPDQKYIVVAQLNTNQIALLEAPPIGIIGQCQVISTIELAEDVKPHLVDLDLKSSDLYVAEIGAGQAQRFVPLSV
ncbi:NHL repeat-containing protein 3-like [Rhinichthys klamathensis goyatoka]|uniref:NHL repeat-containing protein 3-like n=1 Tax=Rhinichthys klamathensis goyatoka TaxID=3034132 RepID=UPI0024B5EDFC|nr:NHL repeat-containing protein 3-like [Rhinichthys klamathensis goyatoka]